MGFFRRSTGRSYRSRKNASAWSASSSHSIGDGIDDVFAHRHPGDERPKYEFGDSLTSVATYSTATTGDATPSSQASASPGSGEGEGGEHGFVRDDAPLRLLGLERELRRKDETLSRLRTTMDIGERARSDRVRSLEIQVEELLELSSSAAASGERRRRAGRGRDDDDDDNAARRRPEASSYSAASERATEASCLREMLARAVAERDRLDRENGKLRSLVLMRERDAMSGDREDMGGTPHGHRGVVESPSVGGTADKEREEEKGHHRGGTNHLVEEEKEGDHEDPRPALYTMFAEPRSANCSRLKYAGVLRAPASAEGVERALTRTLQGHFAHVWKAVREDDREGERDDAAESYGFPTSALARHCVERCRGMSREEEVRGWCSENVGVEIRRIGSTEERIPRAREEGKERGKRGSAKSKRKVKKKFEF